MSDFVEQIRRQAKDSVSGELFGKEAHKSTLLWSVADHIDSLEHQLAEANHKLEWYETRFKPPVQPPTDQWMETLKEQDSE